MKYTIIFAVVLLVLVNAAMADDRYYALDLNYYGGVITYRGINVLSGTAPEAVDEGAYTLKLISFYNTVLHESKFDVQAQEYMGMKESKDFTLYMPYNKEGAELVIFKDRERIFGYSVASFADVCGDGTCQLQESYESCNKDCPSGMQDDYCDMQADGKCDPDCNVEMDVDCAGKSVVEPEIEEEQKVEEELREEPVRERMVKEDKERASILYYIIPALVIIILIIAAIHFSGKGKVKKQSDEKLSKYIDDNLGKGYAPEQIKKVLLDHGYKSAEIARLFRKLM